jgi:CRP/FNR family transcriptional regulator
MGTLPVTDERAGRTAHTGRCEGGAVNKKTARVGESTVFQFPSQSDARARRNGARTHGRPGEFFRNLSTRALIEFESLAETFSCPETTVLIREEQESSNVLFLLEGRVKISINSIDGRRLILGIAWPGEILGLTSAVSGFQHVITAEAHYPCTIASLRRLEFLDYLKRYPVASQNVMCELSLDFNRSAQQLRTIGLAVTASTKFARLVLEWCKDGEETKGGVKIQCSLTHGEIGEYIGVSRETITRILRDLKSQGLVEQRGSILIVPSLEALEACEYAI